MEMREHRIVFDSGGLSLEATVHDADAPLLAAVVLHPHPQYGGDMDNLVVLEVCSWLAGASASTLRFNFRGAGGSEGAFDGGIGERDDALSALRTLRERAPGVPVLLVGYSFGALVAAAAAGESGCDGLVLVSPPVAYAALPPLPDLLPVLIITGDRDPIAPPDSLRRLERPDLHIVVAPGVDHVWWSGLDLLRRELLEFAAALLVERHTS
ncbi:MAG: alpha/beta fold hydrolase [Dehalococcoidia bacterium]